MKIVFRALLLLLILLCTSLLFDRSLYDVKALVKIDPIPKTKELIKENKYAKAHEYLEYFLQFEYVSKNSEAQILYEKIKAHRNTISYQGEKIVQGLMEGISDEPIGNTSAIISDFFLFGDLRDLFIQGMKYSKNEEVDEVLVTLSSIGVIASATSYMSAQATAPTKVAISSLKIARRSNKMPNWIIKYLKNTYPIIKQTKDIKPIKRLLDNINLIKKENSIIQTVNIISKTKNLSSLSKASKISLKYGNKTNSILQIAGKNSISLLDSLKYFSKEIVISTSKYGVNGLKGLGKLGTKRFLLRVGKTTYKGNFDYFYNYLLKNISSSVLILIVLFCSGYFLNLIRKNLTKKKAPNPI